MKIEHEKPEGTRTCADFNATMFRYAMTLEIAEVCHEANRAICAAQGDMSQKPWREAEDWQKQSCIRGVQFALKNPELTPDDQHKAWFDDKIANGWKWGPVKDPAQLEHPCLVPYDELPTEQKTKDHVFRAIVKALAHNVTGIT